MTIRSMSHVVLCHGYSLAEHPKLKDVKDSKGGHLKGKYGDWEKVCLGPNGRIATALRLASNLDANAIIWSTGASWYDGVSEARFMSVQALELVDRYAGFRSTTWLDYISQMEEDSVNTATTMTAVLPMMDKFIPVAGDRVMLHHVTSANHLPRVMREAAKAFKDMNSIVQGGTPASTCYGGKTPNDVLVDDLGQSYIAKADLRRILDNLSAEHKIDVHTVRGALGL